MAQQLATSKAQPTGEHLRVVFTTHVEEFSLVRFIDLAP
jgi:hypothetical protein